MRLRYRWRQRSDVAAIHRALLLVIGRFSHAGARVKVMRCMAAGPPVPLPGCDRRMFDAGLGLNLDLAGAGVQPVVRPLLILHAWYACITCTAHT